jgi:hypothetical protein
MAKGKIPAGLAKYQEEKKKGKSGTPAKKGKKGK